MRGLNKGGSEERGNGNGEEKAGGRDCVCV